MNALRPDKPTMVWVPRHWPTEAMIGDGHKIERLKQGNNSAIYLAMVASAPVDRRGADIGECVQVPLHDVTPEMKEAMQRAYMRGARVIDIYIAALSTIP